MLDNLFEDKSSELVFKHRFGKWIVGALAGFFATVLAEKIYSKVMGLEEDSKQESGE